LGHKPQGFAVQGKIEKVKFKSGNEGYVFATAGQQGYE